MLAIRPPARMTFAQLYVHCWLGWYADEQKDTIFVTTIFAYRNPVLPPGHDLCSPGSAISTHAHRDFHAD